MVLWKGKYYLLDIYCQADLHHPASSLTDTLDDKEK